MKCAERNFRGTRRGLPRGSRKQCRADFAPARYRGRRPRGGLTPEQVIGVAIITIAAMLALTIHATSEWTGMSAGDQLYHALYVLEDWE